MAQSPLIIKIFLGYLYHGELKVQLNQSPLWKEAKLFHTQDLIESQFQGREYIGNFIESLLSYNQLKEKEQDIRKQLQFYCPKLNVDKQTLYLFPQIFLS